MTTDFFTVLHKYAKILFLCLVLFGISFFNYFFFFFYGAWFLPLTIFIIFLFHVWNYEIPLCILLILGLFEDSLANGILGIYPFIYVALEYILSSKLNKYLVNKYGLILFFVCAIAINILTYTAY